VGNTARNTPFEVICLFRRTFSGAAGNVLAPSLHEAATGDSAAPPAPTGTTRPRFLLVLCPCPEYDAAKETGRSFS
jgi:hypothetical protein